MLSDTRGCPPERTTSHTASQHVLPHPNPADSTMGVGSVDTSNDEALRQQLDERINRFSQALQAVCCGH